MSAAVKLWWLEWPCDGEGVGIARGSGRTKPSDESTREYLIIERARAYWSV